MNGRINIAFEDFGSGKDIHPIVSLHEGTSVRIEQVQRHYGGNSPTTYWQTHIVVTGADGTLLMTLDIYSDENDFRLPVEVPPPKHAEREDKNTVT